jgi:hypothetical protein
MILARLMPAVRVLAPRSCSRGRGGFWAMLRRHLSRRHPSLATLMLLMLMLLLLMLLLLMLLMPPVWFAATTIPVAKAISSLMPA